MTEFFSFLTIIAQVIIVGLLMFWYFSRKKQSKLFKYVIKYSNHFSFTLALFATLGSLYYSEIMGYEPCKYCWFQRILMYPLVVILLVAIRKNHKNTSDYVLPLAGMGTLLAGYHYLTQLGWLPSTCIATGYSVGCAKIFVMTYGYITIPMMAFTAFLFIFVLQLLKSKYSASK